MKGHLRISLADVLRLSFLTLIVGQLGRIPLISAGSKEAPLLANDVAVLGAVLFGGLLALRERRLAVDRVSALVAMFAFVGGVSSLLAVSNYELSVFELGFSLAYLARWSVYFALYIVVFNFIWPGEIGRIWRGLESAVVAFALFGLFQSWFLPDFAQRIYPDAPLYTQWDPQGRRLVSTFLDPNLAGGLIAIVVLVQLARLSFLVPQDNWKILVLLVALAFTLSRSSILAFFVGLAFILAMRGIRRPLVRIVLLAGLLLVPVVPFLFRLAVAYRKLDPSDPSLLARFVSWSQAVSVWAENPILGVGFNTYGFVQARDGSNRIVQSSFGLDGGLLFVGVLTGVIGLVLFVAVLGRLFWEARGVWADDRVPPEERGLALGAAAATVALLVHSLFVNSLFYPFINHVWWVLWGFVALISRSADYRSLPRFSLASPSSLIWRRRVLA